MQRTKMALYQEKLAELEATDPAEYDASSRLTVFEPQFHMNIFRP